MAQLNSPFLRGLFRFGSGAGIVVEGEDLVVYLARVRPGGATLLDTMRIASFRERPAAEWGDEYNELLRKHSLAYLPATVVLPREQVIARRVALPGVNDQDAPAAIRFQLDALHPFAEDEVVHDFQRAGRSDTFVVAIAERRHIDFYTALFAEAGMKVAGFTFSGGAVFPSLRLFARPPADGVLAVAGLTAGVDGPLEVYGESPSYPLFSAEFDLPAERAAALAAAELRLAPETEPQDLINLLPAWRSAPDNFDFSDAGRSRAALPWAAALASACPRLGTPVNLLPAELRINTNRMAYVPSIVLGVILLGLCIAWLARDSVMNRRYLEVLNTEIQHLEPKAKQLEALDRRIADASERMQLLDNYRKRTKQNLDIVLELTQTLPPPSWIMTLQIDPKTVTIQGETEQADGLLKKLDGLPRFSGSEFTMPLARTGTGEIFRVRTQRKGAAQ
jgi:Tfp pilus assembly protein PilN